MSESQRSGRKYAKISVKRRNQLIELVLTNGKGVAQAAKRLNIKLSTAKHIIKTYEEKGYLYNKKMNKKQSSKEKFQKQSQQSPQNIELPTIKQQNHEEVKIETKSQSTQNVQQPICTQNYDAIYPLSQFACIPYFLFYSNNNF